MENVFVKGHFWSKIYKSLLKQLKLEMLCFQQLNLVFFAQADTTPKMEVADLLLGDIRMPCWPSLANATLHGFVKLFLE